MRIVSALVPLLAQAAPAEDLSRYRMEPMGWVFMIGSISMVIALVVFCYWKVLTSPRATEHMHTPLDIDTHDRDT
ncbi:MAG TPA: hypothetical protein VMS86_07585 [Thermoanaerobaculia bacterium]|nr:hypothetical protein [Thermoanaerobaculia bacterium]